MADTLVEFRAGWRDRVKHWIIQRLPPGNNAEADRRFQKLMELEVPSNDELIEMEKRGELPSEEELERGGH